MAKLFAGLDVSDEKTSICVVNGNGTPVLEADVPTSAAAIGTALKPLKRHLREVGLESGTHAARLYKRLGNSGYPMVCLDARHAHASLSARRAKTDANDAQGLARLLARGIYTRSFVKSDDAQRIKMLLVLRRSMIRKAKDMEICVKMNLKQVDPAERNVLREGRPRKSANPVDAALQLATQGILRSITATTTEIASLQRVVEQLAKADPVCRRLMTIPGVGPLSALTYRHAVDDPFRFKSSRAVGAYFGLTPKVRQSGATHHIGGITRAGDSSVMAALYSSAHSMLTTSRSTSSLRRWGLRLAEKKGRKVAYVAVARKLAILMHHLWITGQDFDPAR